jgi:hypothetical protein
MIHTLISSTPSLCGHEWTLLQINGCDCGFQSPRRWLPPHLEQRNALETHRPCCAWCASIPSYLIPQHFFWIGMGDLSRDELVLAFLGGQMFNFIITSPSCSSSDLSIVLPDQTSVEQLRREIQIFGIMASESPAWCKIQLTIIGRTPALIHATSP